MENRLYLGQEIKKLGFGLMRLPMSGDDVDLPAVTEMVDHYLQNGFSYFDTSPVYVRGLSEDTARQAIVERYPRDSFQIATKLPMWILKKKEDMEFYFNRSLARLGTDYIDFYLLHGLSVNVSDRFPGSYIEKADEYDAWGFVRQKKAEGKIRHIGFSFHDSAAVLDDLLTRHPETEFVQLQINYADWDDPVIQSRECHAVARKHGVPVVVMEPVKGGTLISPRPEIRTVFGEANPKASLASWAIRYAASLDGIITVLSGMSTMEHVTDNCSYMKEFKPLSPEERLVVDAVRKILKSTDSIACTACQYCVESCPMNIDIPGVFEITNDYRVFNDLSYSRRRYANRTESGGKASGCISCGACENHCPQKLPIITLLEECAGLLESAT